MKRKGETGASCLARKYKEQATARKNHTRKGVEYMDAQEMHANHPDTFDAPDKEELDSLKKGGVVKVCTRGERFWVILTKVDGDKLTGTVNNFLVDLGGHGLQYEDRIEFEKKNILAIENR